MRLLSDPRVHRFIPSEPPTDEAALTRRLERLESRRSPDGREYWLNWVVFRGDAAIGTVQATVQPTDRSAAVAYIFHPEVWGHGYAADAMHALIEHLHQSLGVTRISANIDTRNIASQRLVERLGFRRVGEIEAADAFKGAVSDEYVYEWMPPPG